MSKVIEYSDEELIKALTKEHVSDLAIKHFYKNYYAGLSNYIRTNQGSEQDAEDIFQEVIVSFIDVVRKDKFKGDSSIKTFLYSLCRFTWLNELKRRNKVLQREEKYEGARDQEEADVSHFVAGREAKSMVMAMMDKLGDVCEKILVAFYYDDLPMKDILVQVDYQNEQVLRNKKYKCLKSLELMLDANPELARQFKNALTYGSE